MIDIEIKQDTIESLTRANIELERKYKILQAELEQVQSVNQINTESEEQIRELEQTLEDTDNIGLPEEENNTRVLDNIVVTTIFMDDDYQVRSLAEIKKAAILDAYGRNGQHQIDTAKELGIGVRTIRNRLKQYRGENPEVQIYINTKTRGQTLYQIEKAAILDAYERNGRHQINTAKELKIGERTIRNRLKKYRLEDSNTPESTPDLNTTVLGKQVVEYEGGNNVRRAKVELLTPHTSEINIR